MKRVRLGEEAGFGSASLKGSSATKGKRKTRKMCAPPLVEKSASDTEQDAPDIDGVHPLLIDHVVDKIIKYTRANASSEWHWRQQLLSMRQVNRTWSMSATKELQKLPSACWSFGGGCKEKMVEFMKIMMDSAIVPYTKVKLEAKFFTSENKENLENFFLSIVPSLTDLTITIGQDFSIYFDVDKLSRGLDLSKLKLLSVQVSIRDFMTEKKKKMQSFEQLICRQTQLLNFLKMLLGTAKNLDDFEFFYPTGQLGDGTENMEPAFVDAICDSLTGKVRHLKFAMLVNDRQLKSTEFLRFRNVQTLSAELYGKDISEESLHSFLACFSSSLTSLRLYDSNGGRAVDLNMTYPTMNNLKRFEVEVSNHSKLACLDAFPNLSTLVICHTGSSRSRWKWNNANPSKSIMELVINDRVMRPSQFFSRLTKMLPGVKKLTLVISKNNVGFLTSVFKYLTCLEELHLDFPVQYENLSVDTVLTGIPPALCRDMLNNKSFITADLRRCERAQNLTSMRNLTKLKITGAKYSVVLTNVTAIFGFMELAFQCRIESDSFNITSSMIKTLRATSRITFPSLSNPEIQT